LDAASVKSSLHRRVDLTATDMLTAMEGSRLRLTALGCGCGNGREHWCSAWPPHAHPNVPAAAPSPDAHPSRAAQSCFRHHLNSSPQRVHQLPAPLRAQCHLKFAAPRSSLRPELDVVRSPPRLMLAAPRSPPRPELDAASSSRPWGRRLSS
jgi:hypothetical protein